LAGGRRLRAWTLAQEGWKQREIAAALGATEGAVSQRLSRAQAGGVAPKVPGGELAPRPARLARCATASSRYEHPAVDVKAIR
jgi:predicted transcriptional regulator